MSALPRGLPALLIVLALAGGPTGCTCGSSPVVTGACRGIAGAQPGLTTACSVDAGCGDHYACQEVPGLGGVHCCVFVDRACATEADCCPGETCPANRQRCLDKATSCTQDADCGALKDRFCEVYTDAYGTSRRCRFKACGAKGECPSGQSCFQGECLAGLPCGGHCEPGRACVPTIDRCQDYSAPTGREAAQCPMTCAPGFIATFNDARNLWDACDLPRVACVCAELPPLRSRDVGRFSSIAAEPGRAVYVSAYDGQHGDLVVTAYGLDGQLLSRTWVDGVPDGGPTWGPSGPRGGVEEPGPDVGRASDIVAADGRLYVSFYDVTHGDLKVAVRDETGAWSSHVVDGAGSDVGRSTSIAVDSAGRPAVAYFQSSAEGSAALDGCPSPRPQGRPGLVTALKLARAKTAMPAASRDWVVQSLSCLALAPHPCEGCTGTCASVGSGPACLHAATGCSACVAGQVCVDVNGTPTCAARAAPSQLNEVPLGVGVFASLAFRGDEALVAAMRREVTDAGKPKGELVGFTVPSSGASSAAVLDSVGDTGFFPDVKVDPATGRVAVGYHDATSRAFKLYLAPGFRAGVPPEVIDTGKDPSGVESFVGTDSAVVFVPDGGMVAVYQDATHGDLKLARRSSAWVVEAPVSSAGAVGFFADAVLTDGALYVSHAGMRARTVASSLQLETSLLLEKVEP